MRIIRNSPQYMDQVIDIVDEYRMCCGFPSSPVETRAFFANLMEKEIGVTFIAIDEVTDTVMGFANLYPSYSTLALKPLWILNDLCVSKVFREQGFAKAMLAEVLHFAKKTEAILVELKTSKANSAAQSLYRAVGFEADKENLYYRVLV